MCEFYKKCIIDSYNCYCKANSSSAIIKPTWLTQFKKKNFTTQVVSICAATYKYIHPGDLTPIREILISTSLLPTKCDLLFNSL